MGLSTSKKIRNSWGGRRRGRAVIRGKNLKCPLKLPSYLLQPGLEKGERLDEK